MQADRLEMPTAHDMRRRHITMSLFHMIADWERQDTIGNSDIEDLVTRILDMRDFINSDLEVRLKIAEAAMRKYLITSRLTDPTIAMLGRPSDLEEAVARAIYDVELARGHGASSVLIDMMVGKPGSKATPEGIREAMRIEPYEHDPESWLEYARSAIAVCAAHRAVPSTDR